MRRLLPALAACALALGACDRVPIDPAGTDLLVTDPDLGVVFLEPDLRVRLEPAGPSGPLTLRIRDKEIPFDSTAGAFLYERVMQRGLNVYPVSVTDETGEVRTDTLYAVYLPASLEPLVGMNDGVARAGAAVTPAPLGRSLVTGGVGVSGRALATASLLRTAGAQVLSEEVPLLEARAGHTAVPFEDGALLLGGASTLSPGGTAEFVRSVEWVSPEGTATRVAVGDGEGPARVGHVARSLVGPGGAVYVYLLGGRVPAGGGTQASGTVDVYRVTREDGLRLERLSPDGGAAGFSALAGPALAAAGPSGASVFGLSGDAGASLAVRWTTPGSGGYPFSLEVAPGGPLATPRAGAAAVDIGDGLALVVGGRDAGGSAVGTLEVYAAAAGRSFRLPPPIALTVPRSEAVATIFGGGRMVVLGGRAQNGGAVVAYEAIQL